MTHSSSIPTEPGTYLFCGLRDGPKAETRDIPRIRSVEVVRVFVNASGKLSYIGNDFFYEPKHAIGSWVRISDLASVLVEEARATVLDHVVRTQVVGAFKFPWGEVPSASRESVLRHLTGPFDTDDVVAAANEVFDRAVTLDIIVPETKPGYAGWWKLAATV